MALLGETRADGIVSRTILAMVVVADLAVILFYGIASAAATAVVGGGADIGQAVAGIAWEVGGSLVLGLIIGWVLAAFLSNVRGGIGLFIVMISFVMAEVSAAVHLDSLIILLSAGIFVRNVSRENAHALVDGLEGASLPVFLVFFALAGAKLDLVLLYHLALPVGIIAFTRASSFAIGSRIACARSGADPQVKKFVWFGLVPQAGLALALAELVKRTFPQFGDEAFAIVFGLVATNEMIAPIMLRIALLRSGEAGKRETKDFAADH
jgi:Kef-type K+ transport system membrane component KefB